MKTIFTVLALFISIGCVKNSQVTGAADAGTPVVEPAKLESVPQSVNSQITDAVTQSKPATEAVAGSTPQ
jgi:hypothetical protein